MKVVCAWCQHEGRPSLLDEREPFDDPSETHGICPTHQADLLRELSDRGADASAVMDVSAVMVVRPGDHNLCDYLGSTASRVSWLRVIADRRRAERRQAVIAVAFERRVRERRVIAGRPIAAGCLLVTLPDHATRTRTRESTEERLPQAAAECLPALRSPRDLDHDVEVLRQWMKDTESIISEVLPTLLHAALPREQHSAASAAKAAADPALRGTPPLKAADTSTVIAEALEKWSRVARITTQVASRLRKQGDA